MPDNPQIWNQFNAGWCPSDDAFNGRKNCLLQMDNLELDKNGALSLIGGTTKVGSAYGANAHTIFSNVISGTRYDYLADVSGNIYRGNTSIGSGGDNSNGAFGSAYNYTLCASGNTRLKDTGSVAVNLGITTPNAPTPVVDGFLRSEFTFVTSYSAAAVAVLGTTIALGATMQFTVDPTLYCCIIQGYHSTPVPYDSTIIQATNTLSQAISGLTASSLDQLNVALVFNTLLSQQWNASNIISITVDVLVTEGDSAGDQVSDFFSYTWQNTGQQGTTIQFSIQRGQFTRVGTGNGDWTTIHGFRYTVIANAAISTQMNLTCDGYFYAPSLLGAYDWAAIAVNSNSSYTGLSQISPGASGYNYINQAGPGRTGNFQKLPLIIYSNPNNNTVKITPNISGIDSQANQIWVFRRGGTLSEWYRTLVFTSANWTTPQYDYLTDLAAETIGITVNLNLVAINSAGISDKIYDILGPIEGRWFYFTSQFMYPSDINDPDLVDVSLGIRTTGSTGEIYLWARRVGYNQILVGTSRDIYLLTGTFLTLPDGTIDVYYDSIGCKTPPISYDAAFASGQVFYLAADGWRATDQNNNNVLLVATNTDRLYRGITAYGYSVNVQVKPGSTRFPCVFGRNKLWCSITGQSRIEVIDSIRQYWRNFAIGKGDCTAFTLTQDGQILAFFASDKTLRQLDQESTNQIDGTTDQTVNILTPVFDGGSPRQRHEFYTYKIRLQTGNGENLAVSLITDVGTFAVGNVTSFGNVTQQILDLSPIFLADGFLPKWWQFSLTGSFSILTIVDSELDFDTRPLQLTYLRLLPDNFGSPSKKRARVWPHVIDTLGNLVNFFPDVDGVTAPSVTYSTTRKQTILHFFNTDQFGIDYGGYFIAASGVFEYFGALPLDIVQLLPIARQFDQVGPEELFRYGKIRKIELRCLAFGTTIPWTIYLNDNTVLSGNLTTISGLEQSYFVGMPEGVAGSIVRVVFGPTSFNFHRYYVRLQVMKSGKDTENVWITLPDPQSGEYQSFYQP